MADLNFVVCGLATIAATVGYACVRKLRPLPLRAQQVLPPPTLESTPQTTPLILEKFTDTSSDLEAPETVSLKRKRTYDPEDDAEQAIGYPENLKAIYPRRKRRSGSVSDQEEPPERTIDVEEGHLDVTSDAEQTVQIEETDAQIEEPPVDLNSSQPGETIVEEQPAEAPSDPIPAPPQPESQAEPPSSPIPPTFPQVPRFVFPQPPPNITARFPSTRSQPFVGFANFASSTGTSSPFLSSDSTPPSGKSIWAESAAAGTLASTLDGEAEGSGSVPALAPLKIPAPTTIQTPITGEEDESAVLELKGVKLFVKRGEENFSSGMVGHVKLLEHRTSKARRLLFRREPLWKVSMNARLGPTNPMRCTFDERECVLRVALKELELDSSVTVIYAFKPGRACKKSDFQEFAESLLALTRTSGQE